MTLGQLLAFNAALLVAVASPGPALLLATHTSLRAGRRAGVAVGTGLALMAATWTMMALFGLGAVFSLFPALYVVAKILGGAYLVYVAFRMWMQSSSPVGARPRPATFAFWQGFLVNLFNPKSVLFAAAVLVTVFPAGLGIGDSLAIVANHFAVEVVFYSILAASMSTPVVATRYMRAKRWIDRGAATVLGALGMGMLLNRTNAP